MKISTLSAICCMAPALLAADYTETGIGVTYWDFTKSNTSAKGAHAGSDDARLVAGADAYKVNNANTTISNALVTPDTGIQISSDATSSRIATGLTSHQVGLAGNDFSFSMTMVKDEGFSGLSASGNFSTLFLGASGGNNITRGASLRMGINTGGLLRLEFNDGCWANFDSSALTAWNEGDRLTLTVVADSTSANKLVVYANGVALTMSGSSNIESINLLDYSLNILGDPLTNTGVRGVTLESLAIFDSALSASQVQTFAGAGYGFIPEPTTASLSLLALAGLVVRRRRKG